MTATELQAYVERSTQVLEDSPDLSLRNTQLRLVQPLLEVLGWDPYTDVEAEYAVDEETTVDYALTTEAGVAVVVETVASAEPLDAADGARLEAAMAAAGVDWGVLSNGRTFVFVTREGGDLEHRRCALADLPDNEGVLELFTREAAAERATRPVEQRRADAAATLAEEREAVAGAVRSALADPVAADLDGELATAAEAFVAATVAALRHGHAPTEAVRTPAAGVESAAGAGTDGDREGAAGEATADEDEGAGPDDEDDTGDGAPRTADAAGGSATGTGGPEGDQGGDAHDPGPGTDGQGAGSTGADHGADASDAHDADEADADGTDDDDGPPARRDDEAAPISRDRDPYVARFFDGRTRIGAVGHGSPTAALAGAIEFLFDQRSLAGSLSVPWPQESERALLNHGPVHPDGDEMAAYEQLSNGYYLCTAVDESTARGALEDLANRAGLRVLFQGDW